MQRRLQRRWRDRQTTQTPSGGRPRLAVIPLFHAMLCRSCPALRHRRIFCLYLLVCIYFSTPPHPAPSPPAAAWSLPPLPLLPASYQALYRYKWFIFIFQIKYLHHCAVAACSALCYSRQLLQRQVMPSTPHGHPQPAPPYTALHLSLLPLLVLLSKNQLLFSLFFHFFLILFLMFTITFYCGPSASIFTSVAAAASPLVFPRLQDIRM